MATKPKDFSLRSIPFWALIISVVSLTATLANFWNGCTDRRRLNTLYEPRFDVKTVEFQTFAQLDSEPTGEYFPFGKPPNTETRRYEPFFSKESTAIVKDGVQKSGYRLLSELVFVDIKKNKPIATRPSLQTVKDVLDELKRLKMEKSGDEWTLMKRITINVKYYNLGQLPANNVQAEITSTAFAGAVANATTPGLPVVPGNKEAGARLDIITAINEPFPKDLRIKIFVKFDFDGSRRTNELREYSYNVTEGVWHWHWR